MAYTHDNRKMMSEINVTPFVDVMLVLLIIFMVTAPMMVQGVEVNLPKTIAKQIKSQEDPLILTINEKKEIFIETHKINLSDLENKAQRIFANRRDKELLLKADKNVPYGFVMKVISRVKKAGIDKLGMVTEPLN